MVYLRHAFPMIPAVGIIWALGFDKILIKFKKISKYILLFFILIVIGFGIVEFTKAIVVKQTWLNYEEDFGWAKKNTPKESIFLIPIGSCYGYNMDRSIYTYYKNAQVDNIKKMKHYNISYIWVNQDIKFYGLVDTDSSAYPDEFIDAISDYPIVYYNERTKTRIYEVK